MKFGGFYEHQLPRPWTQESEHTLLKHALDEVELSDRSGFDYIWATEHHFLEEYAHSSAPEVFLAACSQRTKNVRIGHGIVQMPPYINHPARVAERIATLDLLSDGRVEYGIGAGASETELGGYNVPQAVKKDMMLEGARAVVEMLTQEPFPGIDGKYVKMPARNVVPKPLQKPHPPMWLACSNRPSILQAARLGLGALTFSFIDPGQARQWVADYYETFEKECVPLGYAVNPNIAIACPFLCDKNEERLGQVAAESYGFFIYALGHYSFFGEHRASQNRYLGRVQESSQRLCAAGRTPSGRSRDARTGSPAVARFRRRRDRPGDLPVTGRQYLARHVEFVNRAIQQRSIAGVQGSRSEVRASEGRAAGSTD